MFEGIHAPSNLLKQGRKLPSTIAHRLPAIASSSIVRSHDEQTRTLKVIPRRLPNLTGLNIDLLGGQDPTMHISIFSLDYEELCGRRIGTRLLQSAVEFGLDPGHRFTRLTANWPNFCLLKTVIGVVEEGGLGAVTVEHQGASYGQGQKKPLEELIVDIPPIRDEPYVVERLVATLET